MTTDWHDDVVHYKYDPLPDEPRHRKKKKKVRTRSDHRHEYEQVCIDAGSYVLYHGTRTPYYYLGKRCKVCGRLQDVCAMKAWTTAPDDMRRFKVDGLHNLFDKYLPDSREDVS